MISAQRDIQDLIGEGLSAGEEIQRDKTEFAPEFWELRSGLLGELAQKLANYRLTLLLTGDFTPETTRSRAFRDYARELIRAGGPIRFATQPDLTTSADT